VTGNGGYQFISPNVSAIYNGHLDSSHGGNGSDSGDIIPPFTYKGTVYSQNWDAAGQALFNNGCVPITVPATSTPTATPTKESTVVGVTVTPEPTETQPGDPTATATETVDPGTVTPETTPTREGTVGGVTVTPDPSSTVPVTDLPDTGAGDQSLTRANSLRDLLFLLGILALLAALMIEMAKRRAVRS
jgi:hypothetical protein